MTKKCPECKAEGRIEFKFSDRHRGYYECNRCGESFSEDYY